MNAVFAPDQDWRAIARVAIGNSRANDGFFFALGKGDAFGMCAHIIGNQLQMCCRRVQTTAQLIFVFFHVNDRTAGNTAIHGGLCNRLGHSHDQTRIKRGRDDVFRTILQTTAGIGSRHFVRNIFTGKRRHRMSGRDLHFLVDG